MSADQNKIALVDFVREAREDLRHIKAEVDGFDSMSEALVDVKNSLETISHTLTSIQATFADFFKFAIVVINRVLVGIFVIILIAMGAKEIPNLLTFFMK